MICRALPHMAMSRRMGGSLFEEEDGQSWVRRSEGFVAPAGLNMGWRSFSRRAPQRPDFSMSRLAGQAALCCRLVFSVPQSQQRRAIKVWGM